MIDAFKTNGSSPPPLRAEKANLRAFGFTPADRAGLDQLTDPAAIARFFVKVEKSPAPDGCWFFTGARKKGYGRFRCAARQVAAHRFSYALAYGPIPTGLELDHIVCSNRACVRPDHLTATTPRQNILRSACASATSARRTECPRGHPLVEHGLPSSRRGSRRRHCVTCYRAYSAKARARRAAKKQAAGAAA